MQRRSPINSINWRGIDSNLSADLLINWTERDDGFSCKVRRTDSDMLSLKRTLSFLPSAAGLSHSPRCAATAAAAVTPPPPPILDFEDHRAVFRHKTTWELVRGLLILRVCSVNAFVDNSLAVSQSMHAFYSSLLGGNPFGSYTLIRESAEMSQVECISAQLSPHFISTT